MEDEARSREELINELQANEARYRNLLDNLEAGIVVHAPDTSIVMNNTRASELLGLSNDQMRGKVAIDPAWKFIKEDNTPLPLDEYPVNRIVSGKQPMKYQVLGIHQPGKNEVVWVSVNGFPVLDAKGDTIEIVISFIDVTERKLAEISLQEKTEEIEVQIEEFQQLNEAINQTNLDLAEAKAVAERDGTRLRMALEVSLSGVWDWDILNNTFYWSEEFLQIFGLPENTVAGFEAWTKALHPDDIEMASKKIQEAMENSTELLNDYRIILPNKEIRWIRSTGHAYYVDNKPVRMIGLCMDITSQKMAEHENLKLEEEKSFSIYGLNSAQALARMGSWKWDLKNDRVSWSDEMYHIFGIDKESYRGLLRNVIKSIIHPDDLHIVLPENASEFAKNDINEYRIILPDNSIRYIQAKAGQTEFDKEGKPVFLSGIALDVTERKQLENVHTFLSTSGYSVSDEDFFESLAKYLAEILDSEYVCIDKLEGDGLTAQTVAVYNEGKFEPNVSYTLKQTPCGDVVGKTICCFPENVCKLFPHDEALQDLKAHSYIGTTLWSFDGKPIGLIAIIGQKPLKNATFAENVLKLVAIRAAGELERMEAEVKIKLAKEQAEESDRLKSAFLANMSHEIRTPMNGILGFAELLKTPDLSGEQQQQYVKIIEKSGARMLNIINDIIDISKIEAGLMQTDIKESNVNEQVEYIYTFFKPEVEARGMKISFRTPLQAKEAMIKTDREKLYAILTNLVKNAIRYSKDGSIEFGYDVVETDHDPSGIETDSYPSLLQFYVKDTGIGIQEDRLKAIFERFIQADISDRMAQQGAGLGLSITKAYVKMLGGKIWVESLPGIGSTFFFTLPYSSDMAKAPVGKQPEAPGKTDIVRKLKILIAEDDEASEMLMNITVKPFSKEILEAGTGVEAVQACRDNPDIDLVLMDVRMPELDGYKATRQIREFNREVVIIAQTAFGLSGDKERAIEAGCNGYLAKPIIKTELLALIQKYFGM
jgi:PAS domain S-box-containing protein